MNFSVFAFSAEDVVTDTVSDYNPFWEEFLNSSSNNISDYLTAQNFTKKWSKGDSAKATFLTGNTLTTGKKYWTTGRHGGSFNGVGNKGFEQSYNGGSANYSSVVNETYNTTNNTYDYSLNYLGDIYNIDSINYNSEYNTYEFVTNNSNYYISYSPTYVTYMYYDPVKQYNVKSDLYFQLPDGRNSFDLKQDDIWGTYFIYDYENYKEVAEDDGTTLSLLHFDGNISDSSYHNNNVYYLENANYDFIETNLNGGLSWNDSKPHSLVVDLPANLSDDYTIEGRYKGSFSLGSISNTFDFNDTYINEKLPALNDYIKFSSFYRSGAFSSPSSLSSSFYFGDLSYGIQFLNNLFNTTFSYSINRSSSGYTYYNLSAPITDIVFDGFHITCSTNPDDTFGSSSFPFSFKLSLSSPFGFSNCILLSSSSYSSFSIVKKGDVISLYDNGLLSKTISSLGFSDKIYLSCSVSQNVVFDELRVSNKALYSGSYIPNSQPFDSNLVLSLPNTGTQGKIALKSNIPISNLRVGGVRPTYPTNGSSYIYLENDIVKDIQQYQINGWYSVDGSIYNNGSWHTLKLYNLSDYTFDDSGSGGISPNPSSSPNPSVSPSPSPSPDTGGGGWLGDILGKIFDMTIGFLISLLKSLFENIFTVISTIIDNLRKLLTTFSDFSGLLGGLFAFLPAEIVSVLTAGVSLMFLLAVIRFFRGK